MAGEKFNRVLCRASMGAFALVIAGCGSAGGQAVLPLDATPEVDSPAEVAGPHDSRSGEQGSDPSADITTADGTPRPATDSDRMRAGVESLLARYDLAYSRLAGDPLDALDDSSASVAMWHEVVVPGSSLDTHVRAQLMVDAQDNRVLYKPDSNGVLLASHATEVSADTDGSITWRYCAFTPWVEVDADSGAVIDDRPFQRVGSGRAVLSDDGSLVVAELSEDELVELSEDSGDACATFIDVDSPAGGQETQP